MLLSRLIVSNGKQDEYTKEKILKMLDKTAMTKGQSQIRYAYKTWVYYYLSVN